MLKELVGRAVLIEWYRATDDWSHYRLEDYDPQARWVKVQGLAQVDSDGEEVPFLGSAFWCQLDEIRSIAERDPKPQRARKSQKPPPAKRRLNGSGKPIPSRASAGSRHAR